MPLKYKYIIILTLLLTSLSFDGSAQRRKKSTLFDGVNITPRAGVNMFYGDLVDKSRTSYSAGATAEKELKEYLAARIQLMAGNMKGEQIQPETNLLYASFSNYYVDFALGAAFNPLDLFLGYYKQRSFSPYILGQFGVIYYNTTETYGPVGYIPNTDRHTISSIAPQITGGFGLSYWINRHISANIEYNCTLPFTDLLDGHEVWLNGPYDAPIEHTTDPYDVYYTASAGVTFIINDTKWKNAPKMRQNTIVNLT